MKREEILQSTGYADKHFTSDVDFDELYPVSIKMLANRHWTPLHIVKQAIGFLAKKHCKILDIGSGVGKFCLTGAYYAPNMEFVGVEQRLNLVQHAEKAKQELGLENVTFLNANFTQLDLREFDHFYFYNSFFENLDDHGRIDERIDYSEALYEYYVRYLRNELQRMPKGTKIVTYHSLLAEIPPEYELVDILEHGDLRFWKKA